MGTDGGFGFREREARQARLDEAAHKRIQHARSHYAPIDHNANHTTDTLIILSMVLFVGTVVVAAVFHWTAPAMRFVR